MNRLKLSGEQAKIIYIALAAGSILLIFWIFIYAPQSRRLNLIKYKLKDAEKQISQINRMLKGKELSAAMTSFHQQLKALSGKVPVSSEEAMNSLSEEARKQRIEVKNINFSDKRLLENKAAGYDAQELSIYMSLVSEFRALGEYLNTLINRSPVLIRVKKLEIKGRGEGYAGLDIDLQVSAYSAQEKP